MFHFSKRDFFSKNCFRIQGKEGSWDDASKTSKIEEKAKYVLYILWKRIICSYHQVEFPNALRMCIIL
jgi:hypothetical protein